MTADLVAFLNGRLHEDQTFAEGALRDWPTGGDGDEVAGQPDSILVGAHLVRFNPARVLAEVDAKRRMVAECESAYAQDSRGMSSMADQVLGLLALPYADHPDYREDWRP